MIRLSLEPDCRLAYEVQRTLFYPKVATQREVFGLRCTDSRKGNFCIEIQELGFAAAPASLMHMRAWVTNRGNSHQPVAFWLPGCPSGPVQARAIWHGDPPPLASSMGIPANAPFSYSLKSVETMGPNTAIRIDFNWTQNPSRRNHTKIEYSGSIDLNPQDGLILDYRIARKDTRMPRRNDPPVDQKPKLVMQIRMRRLSKSTG
ncbi:MAG: hypothetical protein P4L46_18485 [Fimbriimonas sp.]|nr:hypothetical protein [Fimbriimonas sp.]